MKKTNMKKWTLLSLVLGVVWLLPLGPLDDSSASGTLWACSDNGFLAAACGECPAGTVCAFEAQPTSYGCCLGAGGGTCIPEYQCDIPASSCAAICFF